MTDIYYDELGRERQKPAHIEPEWRISSYCFVQNVDGDPHGTANPE